MEIKKFDIPGPVEITSRIFKDERGLFFESYRSDILDELGLNTAFVQDNQSFSFKNVLRGIHLQNNPHAQDKLVRVIKGKVLDIAVDLRPDSPTLGMSVKVILDDRSNNMFYIPKGFGHGFLALEDCILQYKCSDYYHPGSEAGILWNDKDLAIDWGIENPIISDKDALLPSFQVFCYK